MRAVFMKNPPYSLYEASLTSGPYSFFVVDPWETSSDDKS